MYFLLTRDNVTSDNTLRNTVNSTIGRRLDGGPWPCQVFVVG